MGKLKSQSHLGNIFLGLGQEAAKRRSTCLTQKRCKVGAGEALAAWILRHLLQDHVWCQLQASCVR